LSEFEDDPDLYVLKPIKYVGIEVWQVGLITSFPLLEIIHTTYCLGGGGGDSTLMIPRKSKI